MRDGLPLTVTPSHAVIEVFADQFRVALPASASRAASSALQSETSLGLLAASDTARPVAHSLVTICAGVPVTVVDQGPTLGPLTALTCTSYCAPPTNAPMVYSKLPPVVAVHTSSTTVQLESTASSIAVWT